jgi:CDGSH-type Zn-finger protein
MVVHTRIILHEKMHSYKVKLRDLAPELERLTSDERILDMQVKLCGCGLSKRKPICDESHHMIQGEKPGAIYAYDSELHGTQLWNEYPEPPKPKDLQNA